jgi:hypothetical protein
MPQIRVAAGKRPWSAASLSTNVANCLVAAASPAPFRGNQIAANYRGGPHGTLALRPRCLLRACGRIMGQLWRSVLFAPWVGKGGVSLRPMVGKIWDRQDQSGGPFWS